jgi:methyltransferase (TIGR00027 family)
VSSLIETARWAAAQRARESERPDRLFFDPLAAALAGEEGLTALRLSEQYNPRHEETANYISIRIRLFDEIAQDGAAHLIRQIVLPGAGMDARAYRLSWPDGTTFYELDHPELLAIKEKILESQSLAPNCKRVAIGADLKEGWARLVLDSDLRLMSGPSGSLKDSSITLRSLPSTTFSKKSPAWPRRAACSSPTS